MELYTPPGPGAAVTHSLQRPEEKLMSRTRKTAASLLASGALCIGLAPAAWADPPPPAPGNGGGASGQCTGPQADRPASCQSQGGPGDQG